MKDSYRIGYLIAFPHFTGVCCQACLDNSDHRDDGYGPKPVALYRVNIGPYKQTCHGCDKVLVEPRAHIWPELFVKSPTVADVPLDGPNPNP